MPTKDTLLNNVLVYAIAEKYYIPELKELAKAKFLDQSHRLLSTNLYPEIIKLVYESTPSSDRGLRNAVALACVEETKALVDNPTFSAVVKTVGDFGFDILCKSLKSHDWQLDEMLASKTALEDEIEETKSQVASRESERDRYKAKLEQVIKVVNSHGNCRHCNVEFYGYLDLDDPTTLRCGRCRTRRR